MTMMSLARVRRIAVSGLAVAGFLMLCTGANPEPAGVRFRVIKVEGGARYSKVGTKTTDNTGWTQAKVGDLVGGGLQFHVPLRSMMQLVMEPAEPPTIVMLEPGTLASIDELFKKEATPTTRLGLAYGAIRAGVAEGTVRGDLEIRSPNATLSKRGTWGFRMWVERGTGRWQMSLADRGLVEAIQNQSNQRRLIFPGQSVNQRMSYWIQSARFNVPVSVPDVFGVKGGDASFLNNNTTGFNILVTNGGNQNSIYPFGQSGNLKSLQLNASNLFGQQQSALTSTSGLLLGQAISNRLNQNNNVTNRPDGNFGVGFGRVPLNFGTAPSAKRR